MSAPALSVKEQHAAWRRRLAGVRVNLKQIAKDLGAASAPVALELEREQIEQVITDMKGTNKG